MRARALTSSPPHFFISAQLNHLVCANELEERDRQRAGWEWAVGLPVCLYLSVCARARPGSLHVVQQV